MTANGARLRREARWFPGRRAGLLLTAALTAVVTASCQSASSGADRPPTRWRIHVRYHASPAALEVSVECPEVRDIDELTLGSPSAMACLEALQIDGCEFAATDDRVRLGTPAQPAWWRYRVALDRLVRGRRSESARRVDDAYLLPWTSWALLPRSLPRSASVEIAVELPPGESFLCAWPLDGGILRLPLGHLKRECYTVWGRFDRHEFEVPLLASLGPEGERAHLAVAVLGAFPDASPEVMARWVEETFSLPLGLWGGAPMRQGMFALFPASGRDQAVFGRVHPSSAPTLIAWTGQRFQESSIRSDWVLLHEMLHLGIPPVMADAKWLDEGIATYLEPLLRFRAGWIPEEELWFELAQGLPRGRAGLEERSLQHARGINDVYWGGALFCFLADLATRRASSGQRGLEDGLRALLEEGILITGRRYSLAELIAVMDRGIGSAVLTTLKARHVDSSGPVPFDALLEELGVEFDGDSVVLRNDRPLSKMRQHLARGGTSAGRNRHSMQLGPPGGELPERSGLASRPGFFPRPLYGVLP